MKIISHRGNLRGPMAKSVENSPYHVAKALEAGFDVEIDVQYHSSTHAGFVIGHDDYHHKYRPEVFDINDDRMWVHCKDIQVVNVIQTKYQNNKYFYHENDPCTITANGKIWTFVGGGPLVANSICVLPEQRGAEFFKVLRRGLLPYGICTDYPIMWREMLSDTVIE